MFEETGIEIPEDLLIEAGVAKGKDYEIHYFLGHVDDESSIQIIVDSEEEVGSTWIDTRTELDDYDFIFDMKENIKKILGRECPERPIQIITKAFARGEINEKIFEDFRKKHKEEIEKEVNKPELSCIAKSYISIEVLSFEKRYSLISLPNAPNSSGAFLENSISDHS